MKSMIKRKVDISLTAHIDMIQQMVLDAYEIQKDRRSKGIIEATCPGNMLYHRMIRQTGHTSALKRLLSTKFQEENNLRVMGVFHSCRERDSFFNPSRDFRNGDYQPDPDAGVDKNRSTNTINNFAGSPMNQVDIIVFSDTLHDPKRLAAAHKMLQDNRICFTNLTLVVFLG